MEHTEIKDMEGFYEKVHGAILEKVCRYCVDRRPDGPPCQIEGSLCCVFGHFRPVVDAVLDASGGDALRPYLLSLREKVCTTCTHSCGKERCSLREHMLCPLSYYFPLVVEAVESVRYGDGSQEP
jgi:hypothetical protein